MKEDPKTLQRVHAMTLASFYPFYVQKAERKGRTKAEVDEVICWLTGYSQSQLESALKNETNLSDFFHQAPTLNPNRSLITGTICGVRVEEIHDPIYRETRYMDKLVDEIAKGRPMDKILRQPQ